MATRSRVIAKQKRKRTGRPPTGITPMIGLRASTDLRTRIEKWAARQADTPSLSEALRRLVESGLTVARPGGRHTQKDASKAARLAGQEIERIADKSAPPQERAKRKRPDSLDAYDLYLRALPFVATAMPEDAEKALPLLEAAVSLDPHYAVAHGAIAWCHEQRYLRGGLHEETRAAARHHAHAAIAAGADDASALAMAGFVIGVVEHDFHTAIDAFDRSLALSPSAALAYGFSATIRAWNGDDEVAVAHAQSALRLSPYDPLLYLPYVGLAYTHFFSGRFAEVLSATGRALQANPRFSVPAFLRTAALASLERNAEAAASARHLLELQPGFTIASLVESNFTAPARLAMLAEALGRAGVPER